MSSNQIQELKNKLYELEHRGHLSTISDVCNMVHDALDLVQECINELDNLSMQLDQAHSIIQILESIDTINADI